MHDPFVFALQAAVVAVRTAAAQYNCRKGGNSAEQVQACLLLFWCYYCQW